eukprot:5524405-Prymnesium_polylepis.1
MGRTHEAARQLERVRRVQAEARHAQVGARQVELLERGCTPRATEQHCEPRTSRPASWRTGGASEEGRHARV